MAGSNRTLEKIRLRKWWRIGRLKTALAVLPEKYKGRGTMRPFPEFLWYNPPFIPWIVLLINVTAVSENYAEIETVYIENQTDNHIWFARRIDISATFSNVWHGVVMDVLYVSLLLHCLAVLIRGNDDIIPLTSQQQGKERITDFIPLGTTVPKP